MSRAKKLNTHKHQWIETTGRRFCDTVLSLGACYHPMEVFTAFRGREPDPSALLRQEDVNLAIQVVSQNTDLEKDDEIDEN